MLLCMARSLIAIALILLCTVPAGDAQDFQRKIPCKTPAIAESCYWTHGRLTFCCGTPAVRVWKIGTRRVLGVFSGPKAYSAANGEILDGDNENPGLPETVKKVVSRFRAQPGNDFLPAIYGEFEVCPLEPEKPKTMQAVCIEAARDMTAK